jgi:hypothetical protein
LSLEQEILAEWDEAMEQSRAELVRQLRRMLEERRGEMGEAER